MFAYVKRKVRTKKWYRGTSSFKGWLILYAVQYLEGTGMYVCYDTQDKKSQMFYVGDWRVERLIKKRLYQ